MARVAGSEKTLDMMVNCKTYPAVSKKYIETVCTGGISRDGSFTRLYPVPFRLLDEKEQYERWDVIRVSVYRDTKDLRPESWHLEPSTTIVIKESVKSEAARWEWMRQSVYNSTSEMERDGRTNGLVEIVPTELYWEPEKKVWSEGQLSVLTQGNLFHNEQVMQSLSERVPWQFKLRFTEKNTGQQFDQKVLAWSYYQGYRRQLSSLGDTQGALTAVRDNVYRSILNPDRSVFAIFGTHSRFKHWMISGLYHLPRSVRDQQGMF
jgi:hypothetical protein